MEIMKMKRQAVKFPLISCFTIIDGNNNRQKSVTFY